jgi:DNA (cytosine-5)-methyltransferase 1
MRFLSVCSGIDAASVAWAPLGWQAVGFSEIERFPSALLKHHYPQVPNFGDLNNFKSWKLPDGAIDLLVGGTPCQSFSVAGKRSGLDDPRGQLMLSYLKLLGAIRPRFFVWENVPGVLSSNGGRDFGTFLGQVGKLGYGFAYRVLDAQYIRVESHTRAVPQRRRRVFVIGCVDGWRSAAAILFEPESVQGRPAPRRSTQKDVAYTFTSSTGGIIGRTGNDLIALPHVEVCPPIKARDAKGPSSDGDGDGQCLVPMMFGVADDGAVYHDREVKSPRTCGTDKTVNNVVQNHLTVRRLMPIECERLQGFPDNYTNVPTCSDTSRYKALGNSMAVNVMRWIGDRIALYDSISAKK